MLNFKLADKVQQLINKKHQLTAKLQETNQNYQELLDKIELIDQEEEERERERERERDKNLV